MNSRPLSCHRSDRQTSSFWCSPQQDQRFHHRIRHRLLPKMVQMRVTVLVSRNCQHHACAPSRNPNVRLFQPLWTEAECRGLRVELYHRQCSRRSPPRNKHCALTEVNCVHNAEHDCYSQKAMPKMPSNGPNSVWLAT